MNTIRKYNVYDYSGKLLKVVSTSRSGEINLNILLVNLGINPDSILWNQVS
jgi:hypothetical protein